VKNDGTVWAWGYNTIGQLGNGNTTDSNVPVQVSGLTGIMAAIGGMDHSLAVKNDGTVWAWGWNGEGELGNGTNTNSNVPVQVTGITGNMALASGDYHSLSLKSDGTVWAWGANNVGQLGNGNNTASNVPILMGGCNVTVCSPVSFSQSPNICNGDSIKVGSKIYKIAATYKDTLTASNGCDSIVTTNLTINPNPAKPIVSQTGNTLTCSATASSYQWHLSGTAISGATNKTHTATQNGFYKVEITDANSCKSMSDSMSVTLSGISELTNNQLLITISPNPFSSSATLVIASAAKQSPAVGSDCFGRSSLAMTFTMYDLLGRIVLQSAITNSQFTISRNGLSNGMYFYQVKNEREIIGKGKLIIQ